MKCAVIEMYERYWKHSLNVIGNEHRAFVWIRTRLLTAFMVKP
jgi:hypothetical protein